MIKGFVCFDVVVSYVLFCVGLFLVVSFCKWVVVVLKGCICEVDLVICLVDVKEGQLLNWYYCGKDYVINVLSFFVDVFEGFFKGVKFLLLGDLVVCVLVVVCEVVEQGKVLNVYYVYLIVYGVLYLLGWDYEDDKEVDVME